MFRTLWIQMGNVINVQDAIAKAADLKVPLGEGLDVLDLQSSVYVNRMSEKLHVCHLCCPSNNFRNISSTISAASKLTVTRRYVCNGDASDLGVTEAKQECSVGLVFEN